MNRLSIAARGILLIASIAAQARATTLFVTSTADSGPGTLRAALASAASDDVIIFSVSLPATITLTTGELLVPSVKIMGPGAANLTISGNDSSRVFHIDSSATVDISGLTISDGFAAGGSIGGGIYNDHATLTLSNCTIANNVVSGGPGGGIHNDQGTLTINHCTISGNQAGNGGGIYNNLSVLTVLNSTITSNSASNGGGLHNDRGTTVARNCTFHLNGAARGGGIYNVATNIAASLTVNNCTFSSNSAGGAAGSGGAIYNGQAKATATIGNSTLSGNVAAISHGGGIYNTQGTVTLGNTILRNTDFEGGTIVTANAGVVTSAGYNLSSDSANGLLTGTADQINTNPLLDPAGLRDNGGATMTLALQASSPAIDKGKRDTILPLATSIDQRAEPRPFDDPNIVNAASGDGSDIGAYEAGTRITAAERLGNNLRLTFTTIVGKNYQVQSRNSLSSGTWTGLPGTLAGNGGVVAVTIDNAFSQLRQFYRIQQLP